MLVSEIFTSIRDDYLSDSEEPYEWSDATLLRYLNKILNELCRETGCIRDVSTVAITQIPILTGTHTYALDSRITEIHDPIHGIYYDSTNAVYQDLPLSVKSSSWVDRWVSNWRVTTGQVQHAIPDYDANKIRVVRYPGTDMGYWSTNILFASASNTISKTGALFSTYLVVGDTIVVSGTSLNNATYTVSSVSEDSMTVTIPAAPLTAIGDEVSLTGLIQKLILTLHMEVSRLPLTQLTATTQTPEIRADFHPYLVDGMLREAYSKQDSQTFDPNKAAEYRARFEQEKRKIKGARDWLRDSEEIAVPHRGSL